MPLNRSDRRVKRTRMLLQQALISLILEKPYHKITVQNILDRADVGRSTFYAHFPDKEALLVSSFDDLADDLNHHIEGSGESQLLVHNQAYFVHAQANRDFYRAMIEGGSIEIVLKTGRRHVEASILTHLDELGLDQGSLDVPLPVLVNHLSGSLLSLLTWWLAEDMPYVPLEMARMYERLVMPGFLSLLPQE